MKNIASSSARRHWSRMLGRVQFTGQRFCILRNGQIVAALIPFADVEILKQLEDELDLAEAREAIAVERGLTRVPWEEIKRYAGLDG